MSHPQRALDEMALLRDRLSTPDYQAYMTGFEIDTKRKANGPAWVDTSGRPSGFVFCHNEIAKLDMAEAYFVDRDMIPLIRWAAAGLDDTDRFSHDVWPTDYGFVWLDGGVVGTEAWGRTVVLSAMAWGRVTTPVQDQRGRITRVPGVMVTLYTDVEDGRDEVTRDLKAKATSKDTPAGRMLDLGRLAVMHKTFLADGMKVGPERIPPIERLAEFAVGEWVTTHELAETNNDDRFILAYLMMMGQTVTSVREHEVDKRAAKRFGRMRLPKRVTVVELRRHAGSRSEGESTVEWAHRWVVRGHWRNQPYKTDDAGGVEYRKIWIAPYVKGPEDKPFVQSTKVYSLVR